MIQWKIDVLKALKNAGYNQRTLIDGNILPAGTLTKIRNNSTNVSFVTLGKICKLLNCQPAELIEYIPDID